MSPRTSGMLKRNIWYQPFLSLTSLPHRLQACDSALNKGCADGSRSLQGGQAVSPEPVEQSPVQQAPAGKPTSGQPKFRGKKCAVEGCQKLSQGRTVFCASHGGGRRCQSEGCKKIAQGSTQFCAAHGGGRRCQAEGCSKSAAGATSFCKVAVSSLVPASWERARHVDVCWGGAEG